VLEKAAARFGSARSVVNSFLYALNSSILGFAMRGSESRELGGTGNVGLCADRSSRGYLSFLEVWFRTGNRGAVELQTKRQG